MRLNMHPILNNFCYIFAEITAWKSILANIFMMFFAGGLGSLMKIFPLAQNIFCPALNIARPFTEF